MSKLLQKGNYYMKIKLSFLLLLSIQFNIPKNQSQKSMPKQTQPATAQNQSQKQESSSSNQQEISTMSRDQLQQWWNSLSQEEQENLKIGAGISGVVITGAILRKLYSISKENYRIQKNNSGSIRERQKPLIILTYYDKEGQSHSDIFNPKKDKIIKSKSSGEYYVSTKKNVFNRIDTNKDGNIIYDMDNKVDLKGNENLEEDFEFVKNENEINSFKTPEQQEEKNKKEIINKYGLDLPKEQNKPQKATNIKEFGIYNEAKY